MSDDLMNNEPERANEDTMYDDGDTADIEELGSNSVYEGGEGRRHGRRRRMAAGRQASAAGLPQ